MPKDTDLTCKPPFKKAAFNQSEELSVDDCKDSERVSLRQFAPIKILKWKAKSLKLKMEFR
jgi:hypothetical protein